MATNTVAAAQKATLDRFIEGWAAWTPEGILGTWADNCTQQNLPLSANLEVKTRQRAEQSLPVLISILTNFELKVHNVVHDVAGAKACIYALTKADAPWGPYSNEHALFLWFDESGEKVTKVEELFDTVVMKDIMPKMRVEAEKMKAGVVIGK